MITCRYAKECEYYKNPDRKCYQNLCKDDELARIVCPMFAVIRIKDINLE